MLGCFPQFRRDPLDFLTRVARDYGDIAFFRLAFQPVYELSHPDYIRDVLVTHSGSFIKSRVLQKARTLLGQGLLTSEGEFHLRQRRLAQPAFHRDRLVHYGAVMSECAARARERWRDGEVRDIDQEMMRLTLAIVGRTLFSADVESEAGEVGEAMTTIVGMFQIFMMPFVELLEKLPLPMSRRFAKARKTLDKTIYGLIQARRASGEDTGDLLSMLLLAQDEEGDGGGMTDLQVRDEALTLFLAGHETTANALTWTWYLLSQHPAIEARLHREIDEVLAGRLPGFDDLASLRYTEMVLAEAMRLYPPAWAIGRMAARDYRIGQYSVPKGSIILMSPWVMHRHPRYFPDPERFDPQRWTPEARESRPKFSYFPFGGGPRVCIGERFAWMEGVLVLATLAQQWRMRLVPGHRVEPHALITLRTRYGMRMVLERRKEM